MKIKVTLYKNLIQTINKNPNVIQILLLLIFFLIKFYIHETNKQTKKI